MDKNEWIFGQECVRVIAPGIVLLKGVLTKEQQIWCAEYSIEAGSMEDGFWIKGENGEKLLNSDTGRGRMYDAITRFPDADYVRMLCDNLVKLARQNDSKMPEMNPTHLLLLYYATEQGMHWHADADPNDGDNDHPIVSITVGNSCDFGFKIIGKKEETLKLESGDVLIWGGANRMLMHCVEKVYPNTCPEFLPIRNVRLNFTFRDAPNVLGKEKLYKYNIQNDYSEGRKHFKLPEQTSS